MTSCKILIDNGKYCSFANSTCGHLMGMKTIKYDDETFFSIRFNVFIVLIERHIF